jgi:glutathione S-transferase
VPLAYDDAGVGHSKVLREAALGVLDAHLADQRLLVGGSPTIDDIVAYGDIGRWRGVSGFAAPSALLAIRGSVIPA